MLTYLIRRILLLVPTLLGITFVVFAILAAAPGGIGGPNLTDRGGQRAGGASAQRLKEYYDTRYGLDKPWFVQYLRWLNNISPVGFALYTYNDPAVVAAREEVSKLAPNADGSPARSKLRAGDIRLDSPRLKWPDLGESIAQRRPVADLLRETLPVTLLLNLLSIPIVYAVGITTGINAARQRGKLLDIGSGTVQLALWSVPTIWAGVLLIGYLSNEDYLRLFPTGGLNSVEGVRMSYLPSYTGGQWERGYLVDCMWHLVLPLIALTYGGSAVITKLMRGSILENLNADYVRTARAKGVKESVILWSHVFRNSQLSLITIAASILPSLLGGAIIVETIFGIPGMGKLSVEAVNQRDRELVLGLTLIGGLIGLASMLLRDVLYAMADPRVTYE